MLTITPQAMEIIQRLSTSPRLASSSGLRVAARSETSAPLAVRAVHGPEPRDRVVERRGGRLYLDDEAARRIDGGELDAVTDEEGRVQFVLRGAA